LAESHTAAHTGHTALAHHFDNMEQQREAGTLGMWAFLVTEIMFFGGLFLAYILYRSKYPVEFAEASRGLDALLGGINTVVLICSSLTMALAVYFAQVGKRKLIIIFLVLTTLLGLTFLGVKAVEYKDKFDHHHVPGASFNWEGAHANAEQPHAEAQHVDTGKIQMFYWLYFAMTGVHALHMIIGIGVMLVLIYMAYKGRFSPEYHAPVELSGLYWHFVDIVWIFLFPLLYLIGAHE
jgi:cytochrome c oxidase subunit 3